MNDKEQRKEHIAAGVSEGEIETILTDARNVMRQRYSAEEQEEQSGKEKNPIKKLFSFCSSFILPVLYGILIALILTQVMFFHAEVPSGSMENTILTGDRILGNRMIYWFQKPAHGDIIIFWSEEYNEFMVKRVIGCPGDVVEIRADGVYVNDRRISDDYTQGVTTELHTGESIWNVPESSYFVMGDNRGNSADSRFWNNTFVPEEEVYARYLFRYSLGKNGWYLKLNKAISFWAEP